MNKLFTKAKEAIIRRVLAKDRRTLTRYVVESVLLLRRDFHPQDQLGFSWRTGTY